ncbi:iron-containing alcohol dehydrogenase [Mangrovihabitans endophyticus]|uniref:Alcohol dehydrogenase, class IV n=1 Tax=Mangrovihabitans endophyticus TaxID=1751298 RepID=A0A8J3FLH9_9ACTN|nr:iron-containing alcohol dehydrogenase [Mangrovihabitans endophyticus]GGK72776.1 hypothetical protein GCM10012284_03350 [Mangrovihabitans endophyticus]
MTPDVRIGRGVVSRLPEVLGQARRVLIVHGRRSFRAGPAATAVDGLATGVRYYAGVRPNPALQQVREAVALAHEFKPDTIVGIGGGSAMDVAKCVAVLGRCAADPRSFLLGSSPIPDRRSVRLVQIPTIAGSGSELTCFATVYFGHRKLSLDHPSARADHVLIDPDLAATVPMPAAAASALDAMAQAVESAWAVAATVESRDLAMRALETLTPVLAAATSGRTFAEPGLRTELARGAALAGAAINTSRTTAAHALSYALTARYGITHGAAVGLHLRWLIGHNSAVTATDTRHPGGPDALRRLIDDLQRICLMGAGVPLETMIDRLLSMHGADGFQIPRREWHEDLSGGRALNNPRQVSHEDVLRNTCVPRRSSGIGAVAPGPAPTYTGGLMKASTDSLPCFIGELPVPDLEERIKASDGLLTFECGDEEAVLRAARSVGEVMLHPDSDARGVTPIRLTEGRTDVGLTTGELMAHTDRPATENPPRYLFLWCKRGSDDGGETVAYRGRDVVRYLEEHDPDTLTAVTSSQAAIFRTAQYEHVGPIIRIEDGEVVSVRLRFDRLIHFSWEVARNLPAFLVALESVARRFALQPGQGYILDNLTWFHGRTSYTGDREVSRIMVA